MYFNDFNSGTTIQNVVHPAKKNAITSVPATGQPGLRIQHLPDSIVDECAENEVAHHHQSRWPATDFEQEGRADRLPPHVGSRSTSSAARAIVTESKSASTGSQRSPSV